MTNEELVKAIRQGENRLENIAALHEQNKGLIHQVALPLVRPGVELEDLLQEAFFALLRAVDGYDDQQGSFAHYLALWVKWWLVRHIQNNGGPVRIPAGQQERIRKYKQVCSSFVANFGRMPTAAELSAALELTTAQIENVRRDAMFLSTASLDAPVEALEDEQAIVDTIPDPENDIEDLIENIRQEELAVKLWAVVAKLSDQERFVLSKRYKNGESFSSCAAALGKSTERARQIEKQAFRKIRNSRDAPALRSFLDDCLEAQSYRGTGYGVFSHTHTSAPERIALERATAEENRR